MVKVCCNQIVFSLPYNEAFISTVHRAWSPFQGGSHVSTVALNCRLNLQPHHSLDATKFDILLI